MGEKPARNMKLETAPPGGPLPMEARSSFAPSPARERVIQERGLAKYRVAAKLVDVIPLTLFEMVVFAALFMWEEPYPTGLERFLAVSIVWLGFGVVDVLFFFSFEYFLQATPGKKVFGLKVIDYMKGRPGVLQILGRSIITAISVRSFLWIVELVIMLKDKNELRIADHAAGTKVIRVRTVASVPTPAADGKV
jgi:uncharacterized RDD family membrane protein YckC